MSREAMICGLTGKSTCLEDRQLKFRFTESQSFEANGGRFDLYFFREANF
jgi:hypothetical protein